LIGQFPRGPLPHLGSGLRPVLGGRGFDH